jgi:hypothetical protein
MALMSNVHQWQEDFYMYGDYMGDVTLTCGRCFNAEYLWQKGGSPTLNEVLDWAVKHKLEGCVPYVEQNANSTRRQ